MLSILFTLSIYITGTFAADIREFGDFLHSPVLKAITRILYYAIPNFHNFNAIASAAHGQLIPFSLVWEDTLYAALYVAFVLFAASITFSVRDLK
jgi:hypothetical protein